MLDRLSMSSHKAVQLYAYNESDIFSGETLGNILKWDWSFFFEKEKKVKVLFWKRFFFEKGKALTLQFLVVDNFYI